MSLVRAVVFGIEWMSEWSGRIAGTLILCMIFAVSYEVFLRYFFNNPTIWSSDTTYMLGGSLMVIGQALVFKYGEHVRVDVLSIRFSEKTKLIIDIVFTLVVFIPIFVILSKGYWGDFFNAIKIGERLLRSSWYFVSWPFKMMLAIGFSLFLLQGIANLIKDIIRLTGGKHDRHQP